MNGYLNNPTATDEALRDGWFHSGDLGYRLHVDGWSEPFYFITGRMKNVAKVGGESVSLDEIDRLLSTYDGLVDGASFARPERFLGEEVSIDVVPADGYDEADLIALLAERLTKNAMPRHVNVVENIERTATGKIIRRRPEV